ncbi:MAG: addiction module protein [Phycisphaeraceae bacterium]
MIEPSEIESMSVAERLRTMEQLWDTLQRQPADVPSPAWHEQVLADRQARAKRGGAKFLTLEQLRARVRATGS